MTCIWQPGGARRTCELDQPQGFLLEFDVIGAAFRAFVIFLENDSMCLYKRARETVTFITKVGIVIKARVVTSMGLI